MTAPPIAANAIGIEIEAALAFGTGHHGTTRGCLLALDRIAASAQRPRRILDLGTGTRRAGDRRGASAARAASLASDIDPRRGARRARQCAAQSRRRPASTSCTPRGVSARRIRARAPFDLVFANILLGPLQRLAAPLARLARARRAAWCCRACCPRRRNAALAAYRAQGLALERRIVLDGWVTLVLRRGADATPWRRVPPMPAHVRGPIPDIR